MQSGCKIANEEIFRLGSQPCYNLAAKLQNKQQISNLLQDCKTINFCSEVVSQVCNNVAGRDNRLYCWTSLLQDCKKHSDSAFSCNLSAQSQNNVSTKIIFHVCSNVAEKCPAGLGWKLAKRLPQDCVLFSAFSYAVLLCFVLNDSPLKLNFACCFLKTKNYLHEKLLKSYMIHGNKYS